MPATVVMVVMEDVMANDAIRKGTAWAKDGDMVCCAGRKSVFCEKEKKGKQGLGCILFATKFIFMRVMRLFLYSTIAHYVVVCSS